MAECPRHIGVFCRVGSSAGAWYVTIAQAQFASRFTHLVWADRTGRDLLTKQRIKANLRPGFELVALGQQRIDGLEAGFGDICFAW